MAYANGNETQYEWDFESFDEVTGDIIDHFHFDKLPKDVAAQITREKKWLKQNQQVRLVLVRNVYRNWSLSCQTWAYVEKGNLPEYFRDAYEVEDSKVPKRFHAELRRSVCTGVCI